jgi:hypothetical protein
LVGVDALPHAARLAVLLYSDASWSALNPAWLDALIRRACDEEMHWHDDAAVLEGELDLPPHSVALVDARIQSAGPDDQEEELVSRAQRKHTRRTHMSACHVWSARVTRCRSAKVLHTR